MRGQTDVTLPPPLRRSFSLLPPTPKCNRALTASVSSEAEGRWRGGRPAHRPGISSR